MKRNIQNGDELENMGSGEKITQEKIDLALALIDRWIQELEEKNEIE
ncbi:hypothetical protein [Sporosarcina highlanderae]|uniref:Uncharacterized protein n=1 Tax=Sporosarcina highlanderae TaxID=3035916 RepID=A0ABT8JS43_9BACL|nr:hypothetical protein [Sporosarcina highlanderae]MDN4607960.1 hypothetical protein [Sporosarcina highlanderae]